MNSVENPFRNTVEEHHDFQVTLGIANAFDKMAWVAQPDGCVVHCNQHWCNYTGMTLDQATGAGWISAVHSDDVPLCVEHRSNALLAGEPYKNECRLLRADGAYRWHLCLGMPVRNVQGEITRWFGICRDIEDYVRTQRVIQDSYEKHKQQLLTYFSALAASNVRLAQENVKLIQAVFSI
ncbi:MAG TPA: PAS domain-containing protein [Burkholderiaceae bacterium]|jgi:PAS domain S-box-containing protein